MKKILLPFILVCLLLSACKIYEKPVDYSAFVLPKIEKDRISVKGIFTSDIDHNRDPVDKVKEFALSKETKVFTYFTWFEVMAGKQYYVKVKWFSPIGELHEQSDYLFTPDGPTWYTWHDISFKENIDVRGEYKIKVYLNNELMKEMSFTMF